MADQPAATVVLGRRGLERDVVRYALEKAGLLTVDLVRIADDGETPVVAVLVEPNDADWDAALALKARIVVLADTADVTQSVDMLARGADGIVGTDVDVSELIEVIVAVSAGEMRVTQAEAREAISRLRELPAARPDVPTLTRREMDILLSIDSGDGVKQTARQLGISEKTVQNIQSGLFRKLSARNRAQAIAKAHEMGFLSPKVTTERPS